MKRFLAFVKKEFYHILRDVRTLLILFGMPIVQILLFGYAITNEIKDAKIAILDHAHDPVTAKIKDKILSSGYFELYANLQNESEIEKVFKEGKVKQVLIFSMDFAQNFEGGKQANVKIIADATDPNTANSLINYTASIIGDFQNSMNENTGNVMVVPEVRMRYNPNLKGVYFFVPGLITIILMLVSAMMTSISITREKEIGTMEVLLASPMKPYQIILAKVIPYFILAFINAVVILLLGYYVFGVPIKGQLVFLLLTCMLFIVMALSLGILISTITKTQQTALLISLMGLMLPTILLSGFIFPVENMPVALQLISNIIPAKWFIIIIKAIMLKGSNIFFLWKEILILIVFTLVFISFSVKKFKIRLN